MNQFEKYNLRDNPFPESGMLNPTSKDPRENGTIFQPSLIADKVDGLKKAVDDKLNLIYVMGLEHERGTGKSALLLYQLHQLERRQEAGEKIGTTYIRCNNKERPEHFCSRIIEDWHLRCRLWSTFEQLLLKYAHNSGTSLLSEAAVKVMFSHHKTPPEQLSLMRYFHIQKPDKLARDLAKFVNDLQGANTDVVGAFAETYLSTPNSLPDRMSARRFRNVDDIGILGELMRLEHLASSAYQYIFLDQLEDAVSGLTTSAVESFCLSLRRLLEVSSSKSTYIVTLHPDSEDRLKGEAAKHLTTLAPLARPHRIDLLPLQWKGDAPVKLAQVYLEHFRVEKVADPILPFDSKAIKLITYAQRGCIRDVLRRLHLTLDLAVSQQAVTVDYDFVKQHPQITLGRILKETELEKFEKGVV